LIASKFVVVIDSVGAELLAFEWCFPKVMWDTFGRQADWTLGTIGQRFAPSLIRRPDAC
jgi:hypothetical protein